MSSGSGGGGGLRVSSSADEGSRRSPSPGLFLLRLPDESLRVQVGEGRTVVGRLQLQIPDRRVSRTQAELELRQDDGGEPTVLVTRRGANPTMVQHLGGGETVLSQVGDVAEMRPGDILCLVPGDDYRFLLLEQTETNPQRGDGEAGSKKTAQKRVKLERDSSNESEQAYKRQRVPDSELIPLRFDFGGDGGKVTLIKLMDDDNVKLEKGQLSLIETALVKVNGNVEAAIDLLLGVEEEAKTQAPIIDLTSNEHDVDNNDEDALAGALVIANSFVNAEPFYHLNWLPKFSSAANEGTLRIREIIPENVERAIIVTYQVDMDWLTRRCPVLRRIPWTLVHGERNPRQVLPYPPPPNVHYHKPHVLEYGCHHGKMMLLFWEDVMRVAITTANLLEKDYERKTQGIWLQDFPMKKGESTSTADPFAQDFENTLVDYLEHMGNEQQLQFRPSSLRRYDYSSVRVALVTSVPGYHSRHRLDRYGHMRLRSLLAKETVSPEITRQSALACQFSSVGSLNNAWIKEFSQSLMSCADDAKPKRAAEADVELVWPTVAFVRNSIDGYSAGGGALIDHPVLGSLCFGASNLREFMGPLFRKYEPMQEERGRVTPHIKCFTRHREGRLAWLCLTSANLSKAAWGALQKDNTQLMIRNFEIGVLFLPSRFDHCKFLAATAPARLSSDTVLMPLPYRLEPLDRYSASDAPWVWDRPYPEPDTHGVTWGV